MRRAFTLIELAVVMAVLGVVALAASSMLGARTVVGALNARQEAEVLSATLRTARATAIASQMPIRVAAFRDSLGTGYTITPENNSALLLQPIQYLPPALDVTWSAASVVFYPTGMCDNSLSVTLSHEVTQWVLDVRSASGQVTLTKKG